MVHEQLNIVKQMLLRTVSLLGQIMMKRIDLNQARQCWNMTMITPRSKTYCYGTTQHLTLLHLDMTSTVF